MFKKNRINIALISSIGAGLCTTLFLISIIINQNNFAYFICLLLSLFYLTLVVANNSLVNENNKIFSNLSVIFAVMYATLICIVYYTQISFVRLGNPSAEALSIVSYFPPRTAFFALDILGYTFLAISTLFLAFSIENSKILKVLLILNAVIGLFSFIVPLLPFFYATGDNSSDSIGSIALIGWCVIFIPICILFIFYFVKKLKDLK